MITKIELINTALLRLGQAMISSLDEPSTEALTASMLYTPALETLLREFPWNFAKKRVHLASIQITDETAYKHGFILPNDCLAILEILPKNGLEESPYIIEGNVLYTDQEKVLLVYTRMVENIAEFSSQFCDALSWRLATELSIPLTHNLQLQQNMLQLYERSLGLAKKGNAEEHRAEKTRANKYINARL